MIIILGPKSQHLSLPYNVVVSVPLVLFHYFEHNPKNDIRCSVQCVILGKKEIAEILLHGDREDI